jgi:hypothetical protein
MCDPADGGQNLPPGWNRVKVSENLGVRDGTGRPCGYIPAALTEVSQKGGNSYITYILCYIYVETRF